MGEVCLILFELRDGMLVHFASNGVIIQIEAA
jgi:hypothetical protein